LDNFFDREVAVQIEKNKKSNKWPDISSCNVTYTIVSQRVLEIWEAEGIGSFPCFPVRIVPPFPKTLTTEPPMYYRLDYKKMVGAELDFEAGDFVDAKICDVCGNFFYDISQTFDLQETKICPLTFKPETWNGAQVFYLDHTRLLFCTDKVVDCAHKYKLTNFIFTPVEIANSATWYKGVDYSKKNWREKLPEQIRQFEEEFYKQAEVYKRNLAEGEYE